MPTVLLSVQAQDYSSAVLARIEQALARMNGQLTTQEATNDKVALSIARVLQATVQQTQAEERASQALAKSGADSTQYARALDAVTAAKLRTSQAIQRTVDMLSQEALAQQRVADAAQRAADRQAAAAQRAADQQAAAAQRAADAAQRAADQQAAAAERAAARIAAAQQRAGISMYGGVYGAYGPTTAEATAGAIAATRGARGINAEGGAGAVYGPTLAEALGAAGASAGKSTAAELTGAFMRNFLIYGVGYQAAFMGLGAGSQSIQRNLGLSQLAGQTAAGTFQPGMNTAQYTQQLEDYARKTAGTGQWQYNAQQILTGAYNFLSQGYPFQQATALNRYALGLSQIGGMQDTGDAGTALLALLNGFGTGRNVNQSAARYANLLQTGANVSAYTLTNIAQNLPKGGLAGLSRMGFDPQFIMTALTEGSYAGVSAAQTAQDLAALGAVLSNPKGPQVAAARKLGMDIRPGAFGRAGGALNWFQTLQQHISDLSGPEQELALQQLFGRQDAGALVSEIFAGQGSRSFVNVYRQMTQAQAGKGAFQTALDIEAATPGQQMADAQVRLATAFDNLTKKLDPVLTQAAQTAADGLNALAFWGQKTGSNPAGGTVIDTLGHWLTPGDPGFFNYRVARDEAARGVPQRWSFPPTSGGVTKDELAAQQATAAHARAVEQAARATTLITGAAYQLTGTAPGMTGVPQLSAPQIAAARTAAAGGLSAARIQEIRATVDAAVTAGQNAQYAANFRAGEGSTGRGPNAPTPEMQRWANNIIIGINQGWGANRLESALGLYTQAVRANAGLTGAQQTADITNEEKKVAAALRGRAAAAQLLPVFNQANPGMGGLEAGFQNTVARFGGTDPQLSAMRALQAENARLREEVARDNQQIIALLAQIAAQRVGTAARQLLAGTGTNRTPQR